MVGHIQKKKKKNLNNSDWLKIDFIHHTGITLSLQLFLLQRNRAQVGSSGDPFDRKKGWKQF